MVNAFLTNILLHLTSKIDSNFYLGNTAYVAFCLEVFLLLLFKCWFLKETTI